MAQDQPLGERYLLKLKFQTDSDTAGLNSVIEPGDRRPIRVYISNLRPSPMTVGNIKELARSIPALHQRFTRNQTILPFIYDYDGSLQASLTPAPYRPVLWETNPATVTWTAGTASPAWEAPQTSQASTSTALVTEWLASLSLTGETKSHVALPETKTRTTSAPWRPRAYLKTPSHPEELDLLGIMREPRNNVSSVSYGDQKCLRVFSPVLSSAGEEMMGMWRVSDYDLLSGRLVFSVSLNFRTCRLAQGCGRRRGEARSTGTYHHSCALRGERKRKTCSESSSSTSSEHFHPFQKRMCH